MSFLNSKKTLEKASESNLGQALKTAARSTLMGALGEASGNGGSNGSSATTGIPKAKPLGWAAKPVIAVAGGIAGMTAASAVVSAVRRAQQDA
jgi:hypothetical protein